VIQPDDDDHTFDQYVYHANLLDNAVARWRLGEIDTVAKRKIIADENRRYYGGNRKSPVTGESLTRMPRRYELPSVLADALGVPVEAMEAALAQRRQGSVLYRQVLDDGGTREVALMADRDGIDAYEDIIATARGSDRVATREAIEAAFAAAGVDREVSP